MTITYTSIVRSPHSLLLRLKREQGQQRGERLLPRDAHVGRGVGHDRGLEEIPPTPTAGILLDAAPADQDPRAPGPRVVDLLRALGEPLRHRHGAHGRRGVDAVADAQRARFLRHQRRERFVDPALHEHAVGGYAGLPRVAPFEKR